MQRIEPARLDEVPEAVADLVAELAAASATLGKSLHPRTAANLAGLVRIMNTYYSNLIEGHDTRPSDIERALAGEFDADKGRRNLQLEAAAHVRLQGDIDRMSADGTLQEPASADFICWLHREFYRDGPDEMRRVQGAKRRYMMKPGAWRSQPQHDVVVGRHQPPSSSASRISCAISRNATASTGWASQRGSWPSQRPTIDSTTFIRSLMETAG